MRIAMLAPEFLPVWGGVGTYVVELVRNLPKDVEIHVITPFRKKIGNKAASSEDYDFEKIFGNNVHLHFLSTASDTFIYNAKFQLAVVRRLRDIVRRENVDIVHSNAAHMPDMLINPAKLGVPIVTTIHTTLEGQIKSIKNTPTRELEFSEKMTKFLAPFLIFLENHYYKQRNFFITVSQLGKKILSKEKTIPECMIRVIHNGINVVKFSPNWRKDAIKTFPKLSDMEAVKILYLSRLIGKKGIHVLLKAIPKVLERVNAHFIFAGPGIVPDFPSYGLPEDAYTYLGYISEAHKPLIHALADVFVLPSFYENFPISILEAMASETAVVATDVGGIPEMIASGYNGVLIPPRNVDALANALIRLTENNRLRKKIGRNARKTVLRKFTWKRAAELTVEYYEEILSGVKK